MHRGEDERGQNALAPCMIIHNQTPVVFPKFSHPDNYWCYPYERAVKRYVSVSSNFKNAECSFAKRESFRELLKLVSATVLPQEVFSFKVDLQKASLLHVNAIIIVAILSYMYS